MPSPLTRLVTAPAILALVFSLIFILWVANHRVHAQPITPSGPHTPVPSATEPNALTVFCPPPGPPCKVLTLSPQEENAFTAANGIFDTAKQGRPLDIGGAVDYMRDKLSKAQQIEPAKPARNEPKPAEPERKPKP